MKPVMDDKGRQTTILGNPGLQRGREGKGRERLGFFPAPSLSLPLPSPLKPWVSEDAKLLETHGERLNGETHWGGEVHEAHEERLRSEPIDSSQGMQNGIYQGRF